MKAGPIWRARRAENVNSLMGSLEPGPPRPPRPPAGAAGGSSCANADRNRHKSSGNSLMVGEYNALRRVVGVVGAVKSPPSPGSVYHRENLWTDEPGSN